jgi:hypothetical protein
MTFEELLGHPEHRHCAEFHRVTLAVFWNAATAEAEKRNKEMYRTGWDALEGMVKAHIPSFDAAHVMTSIEEHDQSTREKYRADLITEGWIGPMQAEQVAAEARRQMITRLYHVANGYEQGGHTHRANAFRALAHELEGVNRLAALPASGQAEGKQP